MSNNVNATIKISVTGGPSVSISESFTTEAYDKINVKVEAGASDREIDIQPGQAGQIQLLAIKSSKYSEDLSFKVHDTGSTPIRIDQPQLYLGKGSVGLLGNNIDKFYVTNSMTEDVDIEILVCRDATP